MTSDILGPVLSGLKFAAVLITGTFGILAILVDYRDRETKRITRWGRIAVIGVISSTLVGSLAQAVDFELGRQASVARQQQYQETLRQFSRLMLPLAPKRVEMGFSLPPGAAHPSSPTLVELAGRSLQVKDVVDSISVDFRLFKASPGRAEVDRLQGSANCPFQFFILGLRDDKHAGISTDSKGMQHISIVRDVAMEHVWSSGADIISILDIPGTHLVLDIYAANNYLRATPEQTKTIFAQLKPSMLILRIGSMQFSIPPERLRPVDSQAGGLYYVYVFPETFDALLGMVE